MNRRDVLIVGGGPTGLAAAILAAEQGLSPVVVEPKLNVIDKACGEGLMPAGVRALHRLGVRPEPARPFYGVRYIDGAHHATAAFTEGPGLGIRRTVLHQALLTRAQDLGVQFVHERAGEITQDDDQVSILVGNRSRLSGRWLLAADGLRSPIREQLGLSKPPRRTARLGMRQHVEMAPWTDMVEVHWRPGVEAYITPVADNLVGVAMLYTRDALPPGDQPPFRRLLAKFPDLWDRVQGAPIGSQARGAGPFEQRVRRRSQGRVLLIGDAAGYLDPITGEGLKLGFQGAAAAVACILVGKPQAWEWAWRRITAEYWLGTGALLALSQVPALRSRLVPTLAKVPGLMPAALHRLG